jgi:hypothetical protein
VAQVTSVYPSVAVQHLRTLSRGQQRWCSREQSLQLDPSPSVAMMDHFWPPQRRGPPQHPASLAGHLRRGGYDSPGSSGRSHQNPSARTAAALAGLGNRTNQYESKFTWFVLMTALVAVRYCFCRHVFNK